MVRPIRRAGLALLTAAALCVAGMLVAQAAQAYKLGGHKWPTRTITYNAGAAPKYAKAIGRAVRAWNTSGVRVRFRATSRRRALLPIFQDGILPDGGGQAILGWVSPSAVTEWTIGGRPLEVKGIPLPCGAVFPGEGRVGCRRGPWVRLWVPTNRKDPRVANQMAVTVAHELGHVLGLMHVRSRCALMYFQGNQTCKKPPHPPWQLRCRLLESDDVRGAIRRYGGRMRPLAQPYCDASPAPGAPTDLVATFDSVQRLVRVSWTNPKTAGIRFAHVVLRPGGCPPSFDDPVTENAQTGSRGTANLDPGGAIGLHCVAVRGEDAYGRTGPPATTEIQVPPEPEPEPGPGRDPALEP
jgi:hypothetical protein